MANYNSKLQSNNTELQTILDTINALPDASGGCECKRIYGYYDNATKTFVFDKPIEEITALAVEEVREYDIEVYYNNTKYRATNYAYWGLDGDDKGYYIYLNATKEERICKYFKTLEIKIDKENNKATLSGTDEMGIPIPQMMDDKRYQLTVYNKQLEWVYLEQEENTTENLILTVYDLGDGRLEFDESYQGITPLHLLQDGDMNVLMDLTMIVGEVAGDKQIAKLYKFATIDLETFDIIFANGYNNPIHWAADGSLSYAPLFVNYEEVNF